MSKSNVTTEEFVVIYLEEGGVLDNIANRIRVGKPSVYQRVVKLRKAGVKLPVKRKTRSYDVKTLNNLIREHRRNNV